MYLELFTKFFTPMGGSSIYYTQLGIDRKGFQYWRCITRKSQLVSGPRNSSKYYLFLELKFHDGFTQWSLIPIDTDQKNHFRKIFQFKVLNCSGSIILDGCIPGNYKPPNLDYRNYPKILKLGLNQIVNKNSQIREGFLS